MLIHTYFLLFDFCSFLMSDFDFFLIGDCESGTLEPLRINNVTRAVPRPDLSLDTGPLAPPLPPSLPPLLLSPAPPGHSQ